MKSHYRYTIFYCVVIVRFCVLFYYTLHNIVMKGLMKMKIIINNLESFCLDDVLRMVKERKKLKKEKKEKSRRKKS